MLHLPPEHYQGLLHHRHGSGLVCGVGYNSFDQALIQVDAVRLGYGMSVVVTLFEVVGVFAFGVGMAAIVLRGGAFWPAILIHALANAALRFSYITPQRLPTPLMSAIVMTLMLIYSAALLWRARRPASVRTATLERQG